MEIREIEILQKVANTVRALSADAIEKQQSGHPGLPLGAADIGALLFVKILRHNPKNPRWMGRDRFVLSAGHGSMFLYALLHLCGYDLSMDDIKSSILTSFVLDLFSVFGLLGPSRLTEPAEKPSSCSFSLTFLLWSP